MKKLYKKWKLALQQYFIMRRQKCLFLFGHDLQPLPPAWRQRGTNKFIEGKEITERVNCSEGWYKCSRCGDKQYIW